ncbi:MAG: hypothetical protein VKK04_22550 [Synechococcales bacterium]|nr:hypothetical protein [Synechococcales bacterium]
MLNDLSCVTSAESEAKLGVETRVSPSMPSLSSPARSDAPQRTRTLPYQISHQVELLNLQAETEALLQQLFLLRQQRQVADEQAVNAAKQQILNQQRRVLQPQS